MANSPASAPSKPAIRSTGGMYRKPTVLFLGCTYTGHRTRFLNLRDRTEADPRITPLYRQMTGLKQGGWLERLPFVPGRYKRLGRSIVEAGAVARIPRPDVIWTSVTGELAPYFWAQCAALRRPLVLDFDGTFEQLEAWAPLYFGRPTKTGLRRALMRLHQQLIWCMSTEFTPWSTWAADSLRRQGVAAERIHVMPPGVDLDLWQPRTRAARDPGAPIRLLFVGGDFARKGGPMLLDAFRTQLAGTCELDIVTEAPVATSPGIRVHRAEPNSNVLRDLYARADLFVLPTKADCFGIATVEAMASGLPVLVTDVGGARDIVDSGVTGWLVEPTGAALATALNHAIAHREDLPSMGRRARAVAEQRFDLRANTDRLVTLLVDLAVRQSSADTVSC